MNETARLFAIGLPLGVLGGAVLVAGYIAGSDVAGLAGSVLMTTGAVMVAMFVMQEDQQ